MGAGKEANKKLKTIEEEFLYLDKERKKACIRLEYERPGDLFDSTVAMKKIRMKEEFLATIDGAIGLVPDKYKFTIDIAFDDFDGWTSEELTGITEDNIFLSTKISYNRNRKNNRLAGSLCAIGAVFIILSPKRKQDRPGNTGRSCFVLHD